MNSQTIWYSELLKPEWAPAAWLFGPVWSVLYVVIGISFGFIFYKWFKGDLPFIVALPFFLNIIFNIAFTPLQFGLKSNELASLDILLILGTLIWSLVVIFPLAAWVSFINVPYLLWVSFATVLQLTITYLNW